MSFLKLKDAAHVVLVALAVSVATCPPAQAETTTLICHVDNTTNIYEDGPTFVELNEAQGSVVVHFSAAHLRNPGGITGGGDGQGGREASSIGPLAAQFGADTIAFSGSGGSHYTINRLTGVFIITYDSHPNITTVWDQRTCQVGKKQF